MLRTFRWLQAGVAFCPLLLVGTSGAQQSPWGLRNVEKLPPVWTPENFPTVFLDHGAGHLAFWLFWGEVQPTGVGCAPTGAMDFATLDTRLGFATSIQADPVIVFHADNGFGPGPYWAMKVEPAAGGLETWTGPCDLDRVSELKWPPDDLEGYSPLLYDVAHAVTARIAQTLGGGTVRMRFHNEAWTEWPIGSQEADRQENLDNYLRSYFTFKLAVQAAATGSGVHFLVGHGSIPRGRLVPAYFYELGQPDPIDLPPPVEIQQWAIQNLNSFTERNRCWVDGKYGIVTPINTWAEAVAYAGPEPAHNKLLDAWMDRFVAWTAKDYFDFTTQHPHDKPYFIQLEQELFEERVAAEPDAVEAPPWFAAETAFELLDEEGWGVIPCPGEMLHAFVAEDYARKWCTLLANDTPFCSPILGGPHPAYIGLFRPEDVISTGVGCPPPSTCPSLPEIECLGDICPLPSNAAFKFLSGQIGKQEPLQPVANLSVGQNVHYRFEPDDAASPRHVDVIWRRTLFDSNSATSNVTIEEPDGFPNVVVYDVLGQPKPATFNPPFVTLQGLGQSPRVIVWTP